MVKIKELKECWQRLRNRKSGRSGNKSSDGEGRERLPTVQSAPSRKLRHQLSGLLPRLQRQPSPPRPASHEFSTRELAWRLSNNTASLDYTTGDATASESEDGKKRPRSKLSLYTGCSKSAPPSFGRSWSSNDPYHSAAYQAMKQRLREPTTPPPSFPDASVSPFRYINKRDTNVPYQPALTPPQELQSRRESLTTPPPPPTRSKTTPSPPAIFEISPSPPPRRPRTPVPKKEKRRPGLNLGTSLRLYRTNSSTNENPSSPHNSSKGKKQNKSLRQRQKEREKQINRHLATPEGKKYQAKLADYSFPPPTPTKKPPPRRVYVHKSGWEKRVAAATGGLGNYDASDEDSHPETTTAAGAPPPWLPLPRRSSSTISPCSSRPGSLSRWDGNKNNGTTRMDRRGGAAAAGGYY
ncbi:hypothetical protein QBC37DRAFT_464881 [Rhypophila decipiens]|uniref:Uncharacterized protein n=1 Tax=Rhypophila decipiens TaxID=261697 RepID=A0AAN6Y7R3_9PEZI|nr:hypothetical protein QBC37DRAFT_464881 [Rhypophila decipiens]